MNNKELKIGWLSPDGSFFECDAYGHTEEAREIVDKFGYSNINLEGRYMQEDDNLMSHGWCYIGMSDFMCNEWRICWNKFLTENQKQFLNPYFENDDLSINKLSIWRWEQEK